MSIVRLEISNPNFTSKNCTTVCVHTARLNKRLDISYYNTDAIGQNLPIIILLHGVYGNHWVWMQLGGVDKAYEKVKAEFGVGDFILVMPSDGAIFDGSGYLPTEQYGDYEAWIVEDVVKASIEALPQVTQLSKIYLSGLSMGGYGALRLGAKYPTQFSAISAHSSITQMDDFKHFTNIDLSVYDCTNPLESNVWYWLQRNQTKLPPLRFDCGRDDPLYLSNLTLADKLSEAKIPHRFEQFDGGHSWDYWHLHIQKTFVFFDQVHRQIIEANNLD